MKYFINMVNRFDVHSFIYFELASPLIKFDAVLELSYLSSACNE